MEKAKYYASTYMPSIIKWGRITSIFGAVAILLPLVVLKFVYGIEVETSKLVTALSLQVSMGFIWWFIDPVSIFPALGTPGTIMACLSGNMHNLRLPCAISAVKATDYTEGSEEGSLMAAIGVCMSVFINIAFLVVGVVLSSTVLANMPDSMITVLGYLLPALYGALFAQYAVADIPTAVVSILLAIASLKAYEFGWLNWVPLEPYMAITLIPIIGSIICSKVLSNRKEKQAAEAAKE